MEKVTVYGSVQPGRGERLPRVDYSEPSHSNSLPFEGQPADRAVPAFQPTRRCSTRLLPNLRYLPPYDDDCPVEDGTAIRGHSCITTRRNSQAYKHENLGAQHNQIQSRTSGSRQRRSEAPSPAVTIGRGASLEQNTAVAVPSNSSTALTRKVAFSKAFSRLSNTMSTSTKPKPQKQRKQTLTSLPKSKHRKMLAAGRQVKTHLRCEHVPLGPVWGGATSAQQEQVGDDHLAKRDAFERRRIDRKIDALCAAPSAKENKEDHTVRNRKREREEEREESPLAAQPSKMTPYGLQYRTRLHCQHQPDRRLSSIKPPDADNSGHFQRHGVPSDYEPNDQDGFNERQGSRSPLEEMGTKRKKVVLKSSIKTPRGPIGNVCEEPDSHLMTPGAITRTNSSCFLRSDSDSYALPLRESSCNTCDRLHIRSFRYNRSDCPYCRENVYFSLEPDGKSCVDAASNVVVDSVNPKHTRPTPLPDCRRNAFDECCPISQKKTFPMPDRRRNFRLGGYENVCSFCGMVFSRSDLSAVSDDDDLQHESSGDQHCGFSRLDNRRSGDPLHRPRTAENGGPLAGAAARRARTPHRTGLRGGRHLSGLDPEEDRSFPDGEVRSSTSRGGRWPYDAPPSDHSEKQPLPLGRRPTPRQGPRGRRTSGVQVSSHDYSGGDTNGITKRTRFATNDTRSQDNLGLRDASRYRGNSSNTDVGDRYPSVGLSRRRSSMGTGILKNSKSSTSGVACSDNLLQNVDKNFKSSMASCSQLREDFRLPSDVSARKGDIISSNRSRTDKQSHGIHSMSRKENLRASLRRGTEKVVRIKRDPAYSLVLDDHL